MQRVGSGIADIKAGGGPALQFEVELDQLDQLDQLRHRSIDDEASSTGDWMHDFSEMLVAPSAVERATP